MAKAPTGTKVAQTATSNAGQGARPGMKPAPYKPTAKLGSASKPANYKGVDIRGVKAGSPKANPAYPGKPSKAAKMTDQYKTGVGKTTGKAYDDSANARTGSTKNKLNQG